jgi:hypothetical protein
LEKYQTCPPQPHYIFLLSLRFLIIPYSSLAYKPLILDDAQVPERSVCYSKVPLSLQHLLDPPDLAELEEDLLDWRYKQLLGNGALSQETPFSKPPWYKRSSNPAPALSEDVEMFIQLVRKYILDPQNFKRFLSNISNEGSRSFTEIKNIKKNGFSIFLQDKSSRFVIARADSVAAKVDDDIGDTSRYAKIYDDDTMDILNSINFLSIRWSRYQRMAD